MSYCLEMSTGDMRDVMRLLTAVERTEKQERALGVVRERCARTDARFGEQGIDLDVTVSRALDELVEGAPSVEVSPAYTYAFHEVVAAHFSDTTDLGSWRRPSWFFRMDDELARHGVPSELRPVAFLFGGPPLRLPQTGDAFPSIGTLPAQRAAALADAYESVVHHLDPEYQDAARKFAELMRFEAEEWESARKLGQTLDTIFFWFA
ncbi:hypothetical protein AQJ84_33025 [Streptomyces resistomycificus]|uniref:DUF7691 domain-containing protein n=2 Tax=Streptomyces resistomycificus TaxID=67356 RepID=A0A0L8LDK0_9ACTN|nr:hypothetical protein ADK37_14400 [Streptomyces resistomycificus]KUN92314.1 hypothetical protein AQJ84_33025 [Streptomyces resistomycificus]